MLLFTGTNRPGCSDAIACDLDFRPCKAETWEEARKEAERYLESFLNVNAELGSPVSFARAMLDPKLFSIRIVEIAQDEVLVVQRWLESRRAEAVLRDLEGGSRK